MLVISLRTLSCYVHEAHCRFCSCTPVLHTIRNRYAQHSIYTYSGIVLIAVNPFQRVALYGPEVIQAYNGRRRGELEPHLFAIAEDAYTAMSRDGTGQTIIVSGERYAQPLLRVMMHPLTP